LGSLAHMRKQIRDVRFTLRKQLMVSMKVCYVPTGLITATFKGAL
jgi:hypothetical protein